jgi:two-component system, LytTR family, response regulator
MMKKIRSIIIDDEEANRNVLSNLLERHCPAVDVIALAESAEQGYKAINELNPDLVFLDIRMPVKSGFDLLRMFSSINFKVIFVTSYDQYAIQAFEFNAVDYILKPIDYAKLIKSVEKVEKSIDQKSNNHIIHFVHSIDEKSRLIKNISVHQSDKVHVIDIDEICYIQASRNYSEIITESNQKLLSTKTLSDYEELLSNHSNFLRINKSILVNINYIKEYTKGSSCLIMVKNNDIEMEVPRRKKNINKNKIPVQPDLFRSVMNIYFAITSFCVSER